MEVQVKVPHWKPEHSTGVPFLDDQHRSIFQAAAELSANLADGEARGEALKVVSFLRRYTIRHFAAEESLLQHVGYPELARHRALHAEIAYEILDAEVAVREGRIAPTTANLQPLVARILHHITEADSDYFGCTRGSKALVHPTASVLPSIGIPSLDREHQGFLDLLERLQEAEDGGLAAAALPQVFAGLRDYARAHFAKEELLMEMTGYPAMEAHRALHQTFLARIGAFEAQSTEGRTPVSASTLSFLRDWLIQHISREDLAIGEHLRRKGVPGVF